MMLLCLTVNAMAISIGTHEYAKPAGCQTTKKVVVSSQNGTQVKTLRNVTARAFFDGTHPLHLSYSQSYSGSVTINSGLDAGISGVANISVSYGFSWSAGEVAGYSWDINQGRKVGYYNIQYRKSFNKYPYKFYTRNSTIFETGPWTLKKSGNLLDGGSAPYFALIYSAN